MNTALQLLLMGGRFDPTRHFFAPSDPGDWWDPSDLPLMYQDSAGTTAAAVNQPVGLIQGQRYKGQRGAEKLSSGAPALSGAATAATYNPETGVGTCTRVDGSNQSYVGFSGLTPNALYEVSVTNTGAVAIWVRAGSGLGTTTLIVSAGQTLAGYVSSLTGGLSITSDVGAGSFVANSIREVPGIHRYQTTSANRPTLKQDANGKYYLSYNGTNSWMQTSAVDFSGTDKMTVVGAWTKLSDAAGFGAMVELSANASGTINPGSLGLYGPSTAGTATYRVNLGGNANGTADLSTYTAPVSSVIALSLDIGQATAANEIQARVNGAAPTYSLQFSAGTGNFGNYPLYWGARAGTSLFFNGNEYISAICGASKTETLIARMERYAAAKAGIAL